MAEIGNIRVTFTVVQRRWFPAALTSLSVACALVEMISPRLAERISDAGTDLLAEYGVRYVVK